MGTPDFSVGTLRALADAGHEVVGVVSQPDKPKGRGKTLMPTPVKEAAMKLGIPVYQPKRVRDPEFFPVLEQLKPDVIVVVAFGQLIPDSILNLAPLGCINVHASLLPKYRGAAPIQWAVLDGEKESGVTIMRMDSGLDTGDMIAKEAVPIDAEETGGSLFDKLSRVGADLLVRTLPSLENHTAVFEKQPAESPTAYAGMITKSMGAIDWNRSAAELERLVRGMNPWPSAYTKLNGKTLKLWKAQAVREQEAKDDMPGTVCLAGPKELCVRTGDGVLRILELQLEGKKRMEVSAFLRGYTIEPGTILG